jgi:hypothetical protein
MYKDQYDMNCISLLLQRILTHGTRKHRYVVCLTNSVPVFVSLFDFTLSLSLSCVTSSLTFLTPLGAYTISIYTSILICHVLPAMLSLMWHGRGGIVVCPSPILILNSRAHSIYICLAPEATGLWLESLSFLSLASSRYIFI